MSFVPSAARTLVVFPGGDSFAMTWPTKAPDEVLDYSIDLTPWLCDAQDTVTSCTSEIVAVVGSEGTFAITAAPNPAAIMTAFFSGGDPGSTYGIRFSIITAGGRTIAIDAWLPVMAEGICFPSWSGPAVATGPSVLTLGTLAAILAGAPTTSTAGVWVDSSGFVHWSAS